MSKFINVITIWKHVITRKYEKKDGLKWKNKQTIKNKDHPLFPDKLDKSYLKCSKFEWARTAAVPLDHKHWGLNDFITSWLCWQPSGAGKAPLGKPRPRSDISSHTWITGWLVNKNKQTGGGHRSDIWNACCGAAKMTFSSYFTGLLSWDFPTGDQV